MVELIVLFFIIFLWLIGKSKENYFQFHDIIVFFYFIYLSGQIAYSKLVFLDSFIQWIVFVYFVIMSIPYIYKGLKQILPQNTVRIFTYIHERLKDESNEELLEFIFGILFFFIVWIQINNGRLLFDFKIPIGVINLSTRSSIEILGFVVAILSMYGIYIGFLQYLTSDFSSDKYLGRSKTNYLIKKSIWYHITQTKIFICILFSMVLIPIIVKLDFGLDKELSILWQSGYFFLLIIYIFLLQRSLYIIRVALLIKNSQDDNLKINMSRNIQEEYIEFFWSGFKRRSTYIDKSIRNKLTKELCNLDNENIKEYLYVFLKVERFNEKNLYGSIYSKLDSLSLSIYIKIINFVKSRFHYDEKNCRDRYFELNNSDLSMFYLAFFSFFKSFIYGKWEYIRHLELESRSYAVLIKSLDEDINVFEHILKINKVCNEELLKYNEMTQLPLRGLNRSNPQKYVLSDDSVLKYLFDVKFDIIKSEKSEKYFKNIVEETLRSTRELLTFKDDGILERYFFEIEEHKWEVLVEYIDWAKFLRSLVSKDISFSYYSSELIIDQENSSLYSGVILKHIIENYNQYLFESMNSLFKILFLMYKLNREEDVYRSNREIDRIIDSLNIPIEAVASSLVRILRNNSGLSSYILLKDSYDNSLSIKLRKYDLLYKTNSYIIELDEISDIQYKRLNFIHPVSIYDIGIIDSKKSRVQDKEEASLEINAYKLISKLLILGELNGLSGKSGEYLRDHKDYYKSIVNINQEICNIFKNGTMHRTIKKAIELFENEQLVTNGELNKVFVNVREYRKALETIRYFF